jgi:hypothetical protein
LIFKVKKGERAFVPKQLLKYVLTKKMPHPFFISLSLNRM